MSKRILIPFFRSGLGHVVMADALSDSLRRLRPDWNIRLVEPAEELDDEFLKRGFHELWKVLLKMPLPASEAMFTLARMLPAPFAFGNRRMLSRAVPKALGFLAGYQPDLIVSTHWGCTHLFAAARREPAIPLFYIYGELGGSFYLANCGADQYFALTEQASRGLEEAGVPAEIIRTIPLIVHPRLLRSTCSREEAKRRLGLPTEALAVVMSFGGEGLGMAPGFIDAVAELEFPAHLVVLTGRNQALFQRLTARKGSPRVRVLGFQEDISDLVAAADALAGKCGTGFAALAVSRGIPFAVTHLGAPNERGNMRFIVDSGHGWYCPTPPELAQRLRALARRPPDVDSGNGSRPPGASENGADVVARAVVARLENADETVGAKR